MTQKDEKTSILFGIHPVLERLNESHEDVSEILMARGARGKALKAVQETARRWGVRVDTVDVRVLNRLAGGERHQGVVAKVAQADYTDFAKLLSGLSQTPDPQWILALDGITDPQNFGSLIRTAEGMGVRDIIILKDRSVGVTPTVIKASAGAVAYVRIYRVTNLRRALADLKERDYWVVGLAAEEGEEIGRRIYPEKLVVVLGSEGEGIRPLVRTECDFIVTIPMSGKIASLNVSVSGGMFIYELVRQKKSGANS